jgi:uncharacterized protein YqeY
LFIGGLMDKAMRTKDDAKFWSVRLSNPTVRTYERDGKKHHYDYKENVHLMVCAANARDAYDQAMKEYPNGSVWQVNNYGGENRIIVDDSMVVR